MWCVMEGVLETYMYYPASIICSRGKDQTEQVAGFKNQFWQLYLIN